MEEVKNHEKKESSCFRHCLSGHCHNCNWGHKIAKILIVLIIVVTLICIGIVIGSRNNRFGDRNLMMNSFYQNRMGEQGNFLGGCGRQNNADEFRCGKKMINQQPGNQEFNVGCSQSAKCDNPNCPLNQANQANNPTAPNTPAPFIPNNTSTPVIQ